jgi:serine/threonine protein kinase
MSTGVRAVKRVRKQKDAWDEKKEIAAMAMVRRWPQYFAYLHGWYESQDCIFLAMDYFEMGDLSHHLQSKIPENQARDITQQLLRGLVELHGMGITHRDLKPTNVFVVMRSASSWDVRIGDFGIAKRVNANETALRTITGTRYYMAPELDPWLADDEEAHSYTQAVDVWALGILLYQMLTLQVTFRDPSSLRKYFKGKTAFPEEPLLRESITSPCIDFITAALQPKPKDRPTSKDTFSFEWMKVSSSGPDIETPLSEVCGAQDIGAADSTVDARQNQSAEPETRYYQARELAETLPSYTGTVCEQPLERPLLQLPFQEVETGTRGVDAEQPLEVEPDTQAVDGEQPQKDELAAQAVDAEQPQGVEPGAQVAEQPQEIEPTVEDDDAEETPPPLPARSYLLLKATSQPVVDDVAKGSPSRSRRRVAYPQDILPDYEDSGPSGGATEALPQGREMRRTSEGRPSFVDRLNRHSQSSWSNPKQPPSYQPGSLPLVPNLRLTGRLAMRVQADCKR